MTVEIRDWVVAAAFFVASALKWPALVLLVFAVGYVLAWCAS